jgi:hypothetical protein
MRILKYPWGGNLGDTLQSRVFELYLRDNYQNLEINYIGRDFPIASKENKMEDEFKNDTRDILLTGWLTQNPARFLSIQRNLIGLVGVHLAAEGSLASNKLGIRHLFLSETFRNEFRGYSVSSRDFSTRDFLENRGFQAPFVGCVSSLISQVDLSFIPRQPKSDILFVDIDSNLENRFLEKDFRGKVAIHLSNRENEINGEIEKLRRIDQLLGCIISSEIVVTSRLHVALPAIALGRPTVLIANLDARYGGISDFLNIISPSKALTSQDMSKIVELAHNSPKSEIYVMAEQVISHVSKVLKMPPRERMDFNRLEYETQVLAEIASEMIHFKENSDEMLNEMLNSRFWRLTSPIRKILEIRRSVTRSAHQNFKKSKLRRLSQ